MQMVQTGGNKLMARLWPAKGVGIDGEVLKMSALRSRPQKWASRSPALWARQYLRGAPARMDRATADYMGMLATVINALALQMESLLPPDPDSH